MGHKTHPIGFRLGIIKEWDSRWFAAKHKDYRNTLQEDLRLRNAILTKYPEAGIPKVDATGDVFNFHALRTQTGTDLARGGAHPAVAQRRLRHATVQLTLDVYTKLGLDEHQDAALKALPKLATGA